VRPERSETELKCCAVWKVAAAADDDDDSECTNVKVQNGYHVKQCVPYTAITD